MSAIAQVKDGQILESVSSLDKNTKASNSSLDKDAFLQLLVAQMKYQDPLEPTSNTEYISQLATFSELEEMQNMTSGMNLQRASALVGQYVFMKVTDSSGNTTYPEGRVDYVVYENNKAYLSINETLYSMDDLDTIADSTYMQASKIAEAFIKEMNKLPAAAKVTQDDLPKIEDLITVYENMTDYQQDFLGEENTKIYKAYVEKFQELAVNPVSSFITALNSLPPLAEITSEHIGAIYNVISQYQNLSAYQKGLINESSLITYQAYMDKCDELMENAVKPEKEKEKVEETTKTEETVKPEEKVEETVVPEEKTEETVVPEEKTEETVVPEEKAEETVVPEGTVEETVVPEETVEETVVPEETVEETVVPEETVEETVVPEETVEETVVPEETVEETVVPEEIIDELFADRS